jgi:hypothetical protein
VGQSITCDFSGFRAFLWENGDMLDLNQFVPVGTEITLTEVEQINDRGEMFGIGTLSNGEDRAFLLIPCDENHLTVEGCDYSMVDADIAATVVTPLPATNVGIPFIQGKPAFGGAANPMLRRFGPSFGPWYRQPVPPAPRKG